MAADDEEEVLTKKIEALKEGQAGLEREMSRLLSRRAAPISPNQRAHSVSPQRSSYPSPPSPPPPSSSSSWGFRSRHPAEAWRRGSSSFRHASPLQRESGCAGGRQRFAREQCTDKQYWKILQSMGQAVHITDLDGRITFW